MIVNNKMRVVVGYDGAVLKEVRDEIFEILEGIDCVYNDVVDEQKNKGEVLDYPIIAKGVCHKIIEKSADVGILICGTGTGMCIAANRVKGIRAALCYDTYSAQMARLDNNCNILCLRCREFDLNTYYEIIRTFLETHFSEEVRHSRRVELLEHMNDE